MTLNSWQMSYNGVFFGAGFEAQIVSIDGLRALPAIRNADSPRPRDQGLLAGLDLAGPRVITLVLAIEGSSMADLDAQLTALEVAFTHQVQNPLPLQYQIAGQSNRIVYVRPRKRNVMLNFEYQAAAYAEMTVELDSLDPRIYDVTTQVAQVGLPAPFTGVTFAPPTGSAAHGPPPAGSLTFPVVFGSGGGVNTVTVVNGGGYFTPLYATIQGPCTNPVITNNTTGAVVALEITLGSTDSLLIDMDAHNILLDNTVSRRNTLIPGSLFFDLQPGATSISFNSSDTSLVAGTLTLNWNNAWV